MKPFGKILSGVISTAFSMQVLFSMAQATGQGQELLRELSNKNTETVKQILDQDISLLEFANPRGSTPLTVAASLGLADLVAYLVGKGANVNTSNNFGNTPLHYAAWSSDLVSFKALNAKGARLDVQNSQGQTPLQYACMGGNPQILDYCIRQGMDLHKKMGDGSSLLHWAAYGGNIEMFKFLESQGLDLNKADKDGSPPLFWAATGKKPDMVRYLVEERHADVKCRDNAGNTPLSSAVQAGSKEITEYLLGHGADAGAPLDKNKNLLILAAESDNPDLIRLLIDKGCDINAFDDNGSTPLLVASGHGNLQSVKVLLEKGARTNPGLCTRKTCTNTGATPLHAAAWRSPSVVEYLVEHGADVNAKNLDGNTPMHHAAVGDSLRIIEILWKHGGRTDATNNLGVTPLMRAIQSVEEGAVKTLLACRADVSPTDNGGRTALHFAAIAGSLQIVDLLVANGANVNAKDHDGHTPAWSALYYGNNGIAERLATAGAGRETPPKMAGLINRELPEGEAVVWYLNHSGWAVQTRNHLLVFDFWHRTPAPGHPCLDNGRILPQEVAGKKVVVFVSHSHADHFMPDIARWSQDIRDIRYVMGFEGTLNADYAFIPPNGDKVIDGVKVHAIKSTDSGEGFMAEVDGVTIFHPGDHACRYEEGDTAFSNGIDFLAGTYKNIDIAFVPVSGCSFNNKTALEKGNDYLVEKFRPRVVFPMHGSGNEKSFLEYAGRKNRGQKSSLYQAAGFMGDRFIIPAGKSGKTVL